MICAIYSCFTEKCAQQTAIRSEFVLHTPIDLVVQTCETFLQISTVRGQHLRPVSSQQCSAVALPRGYLAPTSGWHGSHQQLHHNIACRDLPKYGTQQPQIMQATEFYFYFLFHACQHVLTAVRQTHFYHVWVFAIAYPSVVCL